MTSRESPATSIASSWPCGGSCANTPLTGTETGSSSARVLASARSLANESNRLKLEMGKFLATIRAA